MHLTRKRVGSRERPTCSYRTPLAESFPSCSNARVSYKSLHTLSDCAKHGAVLLITCQCGRQVWKGPRDFTHPGDGVRAVRAWMPIDRLALMLKCRCGRKGMVVQVEHSPRVPAGIPMLPFLNADDRQRKRMIRIARG